MLSFDRFIDRRAFLQYTAAGAATAALLPGVAPAQGRRPNLLYIMSDDLGYADLSFTGRTDYRTPVLDALAREGMSFTQAYTAAPVCTPTRVALATGRYPARTPVGLYEPLTRQPIGLPADPPTLSRLIKQQGYETGLIGKWHLGVLPEFHPFRHGYDEFYGFLGGAADYHSHIDTETLKDFFYDGEKPAKAEGYLTDLFTDRAVRFVTRERRAPFFLNLEYNAPHWPWQAAGDPPYTQDTGVAHWRAGGSPATYAKMVESMDAGVGKVLEALRRRRLERDTLVIFTSDNGGEKFSQMGPYSHGKMTLYEGGLRVPAFARWPGVIRAGSSSDQVMVTQDWTATLLAVAGAKADPRAPLDGIDLQPALKGGRSVPRDLYWRLTQRAQYKAMRSGDWKYLVIGKEEFLFDLSADRGETKDLKGDHPEVFARLKKAYAEWELTVLPPVLLD
jgi:arylsulfatase A-like enzyme